MKKIILLVWCLGFSGFVLPGCSNNSDPFVQKEYTAGAPQVEEIRIDVRDRKIEVSISEDDQIRISYFENSKETYDITVSDQNVLMMVSESNKNWTDYIGVKPSAENRKISLQILNSHLDTLILSTTNEDITVSELVIAGSISLSANNGNIIFDNLDVDNALYLTVKNGGISGKVIGSYDDFAIQSKVKKAKVICRIVKMAEQKC